MFWNPNIYEQPIEKNRMSMVFKGWYDSYEKQSINVRNIFETSCNVRYNGAINVGFPVMSLTSCK